MSSSTTGGGYQSNIEYETQIRANGRKVGTFKITGTPEEQSAVVEQLKTSIQEARAGKIPLDIKTVDGVTIVETKGSLSDHSTGNGKGRLQVIERIGQNLQTNAEAVAQARNVDIVSRMKTVFEANKISHDPALTDPAELLSSAIRQNTSGANQTTQLRAAITSDPQLAAAIDNPKLNLLKGHDHAFEGRLTEPMPAKPAQVRVVEEPVRALARIENPERGLIRVENQSTELARVNQPPRGLARIENTETGLARTNKPIEVKVIGGDHVGPTVRQPQPEIIDAEFEVKGATKPAKASGSEPLDYGKLPQYKDMSTEMPKAPEVPPAKGWFGRLVDWATGKNKPAPEPARFSGDLRKDSGINLSNPDDSGISLEGPGRKLPGKAPNPEAMDVKLVADPDGTVRVAPIDEVPTPARLALENNNRGLIVRDQSTGMARTNQPVEVKVLEVRPAGAPARAGVRVITPEILPATPAVPEIIDAEFTVKGPARGINGPRTQPANDYGIDLAHPNDSGIELKPSPRKLAGPTTEQVNAPSATESSHTFEIKGTPEQIGQQVKFLKNRLGAQGIEIESAKPNANGDFIVKTKPSLNPEYAQQVIEQARVELNDFSKNMPKAAEPVKAAKGTTTETPTPAAKPWWKRWFGSKEEAPTRTAGPRTDLRSDSGTDLSKPNDNGIELESSRKAAPVRGKTGPDVKLVADGDTAKLVPTDDTPTPARQPAPRRVQAPVEDQGPMLVEETGSGKPQNQQAGKARAMTPANEPVGTIKISADAGEPGPQIKFLKGRLNANGLEISKITPENGELTVEVKAKRPLSPEQVEKGLNRATADLNDFNGKAVAEPAKAPAKKAVAQDVEPVKKPGMYNGPDKGSEFEARLEAAKKHTVELQEKLDAPGKMSKAERGLLEKDLARTNKAIGELEKGMIPEEAKITPPKKSPARVSNEPLEVEPARAPARIKAPVDAEPAAPRAPRRAAPVEPEVTPVRGGGRGAGAVAGEAEAVNPFKGSQAGKIGGAMGVVFGGYQIKEGLDKGNVVETGLGITNLASGVGLLAASSKLGTSAMGEAAAGTVGRVAGGAMLGAAAVSIAYESMKEQGTGADDKWAYRGARAAAGGGSLAAGLAAGKVASMIVPGGGWISSAVGIGAAVGTTMGASYLANSAIDAHKEDKIARKKDTEAYFANRDKTSTKIIIEDLIKKVSSDGSKELKRTDFDPQGTGKLSLANFAEPNGNFTKDSLQQLNNKVKAMDQLVELTNNPELRQLRDGMKTLAADAKKELGHLEVERSYNSNGRYSGPVSINTDAIAGSTITPFGAAREGSLLSPNLDRALQGVVPVMLARDTGPAQVTNGQQVTGAQRQANVPQGAATTPNGAAL